MEIGQRKDRRKECAQHSRLGSKKDFPLGGYRLDDVFF